MYTDEAIFVREMRRARRKWGLLVSRFRQSNRMKIVVAAEVENRRADIAASPTKSNDSHLLALALAGGAEVLCADDADLETDFTNKEVLPRLPGRDRAIYPWEAPQAQKKFLDRRRCPRRC